MGSPQPGVPAAKRKRIMLPLSRFSMRAASGKHGLHPILSSQGLAVPHATSHLSGDGQVAPAAGKPCPGPSHTNPAALQGSVQPDPASEVPSRPSKGSAIDAIDPTESGAIRIKLHTPDQTPSGERRQAHSRAQSGPKPARPSPGLLNESQQSQQRVDAPLLPAEEPCAKPQELHQPSHASAYFSEMPHGHAGSTSWLWDSSKPFYSDRGHLIQERIDHPHSTQRPFRLSPFNTLGPEVPNRRPCSQPFAAQTGLRTTSERLQERPQGRGSPGLSDMLKVECELASTSGELMGLRRRGSPSSSDLLQEALDATGSSSPSQEMQHSTPPPGLLSLQHLHMVLSSKKICKVSYLHSHQSSGLMSASRPLTSFLA